MTARILLVDDEPAVLKAWTKALRHAGHHVTSASSPDEALVAADEHIFDVLVVDYVMPAMTAVELLARVRKKQPLVRAIVVSGRIEGTLTEDESGRPFKKPLKLIYIFISPFQTTVCGRQSRRLQRRRGV